ncbi:L1 [Human papillomavirus 180]|uniref:Major capsid protein L1 n=1 Tax=Human papillomavirus 180 TaxID=1449827 RepID=L7WY91_9PAPI|nr:L1 [Human papillomavirus 180]
MALLWMQNPGKLYLPPSRPVARILNTEEYVKGTSIYFHAGSDRLLTVGHPYFNVLNNGENKVDVPKVSGNQYRVLRVMLPDPNKFALVDTDVYNPETQRLVWRLRGIEIQRGGPLGIGTTGHPLLNKLGDTENPTRYLTQSRDDRQNVSMDPKQTQLFIVGCKPSLGAHWDLAKPCVGEERQNGDCYPIELVHSVIEDGDMGDIGFGAVNFKTFQQDHSGVPLDIVASTCKWPDFVKMTKEAYGNSMFFYGKREQLYARHFYTRAGTIGDTIPGPFNPKSDFLTQPDQTQNQKTISSHIYFGTPSGSLVSSEASLFNRPYWLQRAQGQNNGVLWNNQLFVTIFDNTHNTNFTLNFYKNDAKIPENYMYNAEDFKHYLRHVEELEFELILQLCIVPLEPDVLSHINAMDSSILEDWNLAFVPQPTSSIEDKYRFITSLATPCPDQAAAPEKVDPYAKYNFWIVDLSEKLSSELSQFSLGRRFLYQTGLVTNGNGIINPRKRSSATLTKKSVKRRKIGKSS